MHPDVRVTGSLETPRVRLRSWRFSLSTGEEVTLWNHLLKMLFFSQPICFSFLLIFFFSLSLITWVVSFLCYLHTHQVKSEGDSYSRVQVKSVMGAESVGQCIEIKRYKVQFFLLAPTAVELMHIKYDPEEGKKSWRGAHWSAEH